MQNKGRGLSALVIIHYWDFVFVSCFDIRISIFSCPKNTNMTTNTTKDTGLSFRRLPASAHYTIKKPLPEQILFR